MSARIEALVFDLGNVLVDHDNALMMNRIAKACRAGADLGTHDLHDPRYTKGDLPISHLHHVLRERFGYAHDYARFLEDWSCHFTLKPDMLDLVQTLAARHRVMIFSNTNAPHWDYQRIFADGAIHRLEAYLSHDMGVAKPEVEAYQALARQAGIDPATSLFFDDRTDNVDGARLAGFHAEIFTTRAACETDLVRYGVIAAIGQVAKSSA